jgi:hypothetical protein
VILVRVAPDLLDGDASRNSAFFYQQQRQNATQVIAVPYSELIDVVEQLSSATDAKWASRVLFLHSTGRCGSTLLCKLIGKARDVVSLSEPDIYSYMTWVVARRLDGAGDAVAPALIRAVTWLLHAYGSTTPDTVVCIKLRSQVVEIADAMQKAAPQSKALFLYRDPIDTIDSFCMAFFSGFVNRMLRWTNLDSCVNPFLSPHMPSPHALLTACHHHMHSRHVLRAKLCLLKCEKFSCTSCMGQVLKGGVVNKGPLSRVGRTAFACCC